MVHLGEVSPAIWDATVEDMEIKLKEFDFQEDDILVDWRKNANKRKFDRELFETYGFFKDIILHPKFQYAKQLMEDNMEYLDYNVVLGEPFMPLATAVIVLFMLHKRVSNFILGLAAAFVFQLNPFYVVTSLLLFAVLQKQKKPKGFKKQGRKTAKEAMDRPTPISSKTFPSTIEYDHVLLGNNLSTLYTAALLSKNGHKCCVLQPIDAPAVELFPTGAPCAIPLNNLSCGRIERYQALLDTVQSHSPTERLVFSPVGTLEDGFSSAIMRTVQPGASSSPHKAANRFSTISLRSGDKSIVYDLLAAAPIDKAQFSLYVKKLKLGVQFLVQFLMQRAVPSAQFDVTTASEPLKMFHDLASTSIEAAVHGSGLESATAMDLLASLGVVTIEEGLASDRASALSLAQAIDFASSGIFYPNGSYKAVESSLCRAIISRGGAVYKNVNLTELILDEVPLTELPPQTTANTSSGSGGWTDEAVRKAPNVRAAGVRVRLPYNSDGNTSSGSSSGNSSENSGGQGLGVEVEVTAGKSVVSGLGVLCTTTKLIPSEVVSDSTIETLAELTEARPKVVVAFWLRGTASELGLSSTDYFETSLRRTKQPTTLTSSSSSGRDLDESPSFVHVWCPSVKDADWGKTHDPNVQVVIVELEISQPTVSLKTCVTTQAESDSTTAIAEPSDGGMGSSNRAVSGFRNAARLKGQGPLMFVSDHPDDACTDPDHVAYTSKLGHMVTMSKSKKDKYEARAFEKLKELYPLVEGKTVFSHIKPPELGGHNVSNNLAKYTSNLSAFSDVRGLYHTGRDIASTTGLAGDLQAGWITANAVLEYDMKEMVAGRNIVSDLQFVK
jgi:hypothetical protein